MSVPSRVYNERGKADRAWAKLLGRLAAHRERLAFWAIVLLAAALRLAALDLVEFKVDEAAHLLRAAEVAEQGRLPLFGSQASVGIAKPPLMTLLMALPLLFGRDPRLASGFIALLNVAGVAGCWLLARRYYGLRVAAVAALLFAVNPWAVVLSRKVFTADVLAPFLVLLLYALHAAIIDRAPWGWLLAVFSLGLLLGITFSPLPLALVLLLLVVIYRRRVSWRYLLLGAALVGLLFVPYLYGLLRDLGALKDLARDLLQPAAGSAGAVPWRDVLRFAAQLHSGSGLGALAGSALAAFAPAHSPLRHLDSLAGLAFLVAALGVVALAAGPRLRRAKHPASPGHVILAVWLWVSMAAIALQGLRLEPHYLVILYPAGFLALAVGLDWLTLRVLASSPKGQALRLCLGGALLAVTAWQAYSVVYLYGFVARHDVSGGYGAPLRYWQRIATAARLEAQAAGVDQVWVITDGSDVSYQQAPAILYYLLGPDVDTAFLGQGGNEALLLPLGRPAVYLLTRPAAPQEAFLAQLGAEERATVLNMGGEVAARLLRMPALSEAQLLDLIPQQAEVRLDSGVSLLGYGWPQGARSGQTASLVTYWRFGPVPEVERQTGHSLFNHLLDAQGNKVAQHDGFGLHERHWREGLVLAQWFDLALPEDLPAGDYTLLTGMYRLSDFGRNHVLGPQGEDVGDSIELGPLHVGR